LLERWSLPLLWHLSDVSDICNFWPQLQILRGQLTPPPTQPSRAPVSSTSIRIRSVSFLIFTTVADPKIVKGDGNSVSAPSSFIANAHTELLHGKRGLIKKNSEPIGGAAPTAPLNPPLLHNQSLTIIIISVAAIRKSTHYWYSPNGSLSCTRARRSKIKFDSWILRLDEKLREYFRNCVMLAYLNRMQQKISEKQHYIVNRLVFSAKKVNAVKVKQSAKIARSQEKLLALPVRRICTMQLKFDTHQRSPLPKCWISTNKQFSWECYCNQHVLNNYYLGLPLPTQKKNSGLFVAN